MRQKDLSDLHYMEVSSFADESGSGGLQPVPSTPKPASKTPLRFPSANSARNHTPTQIVDIIDISDSDDPINELTQQLRYVPPLTTTFDDEKRREALKEFPIKPQMRLTSQTNTWLGTCNNPEPFFPTLLEALLQNQSAREDYLLQRDVPIYTNPAVTAIFLMYVHEYGPMCHTPHYHFYIKFGCKEKLTVQQLSAYFNGKCYLAIPAGTVQQNLAYMQKTGATVEIRGNKDLLSTKNKNELSQLTKEAEFKTKLEECATIKDFMNKYTQLYCHMRGGITDWYNAKAEPTTTIRELDVFWFHGPTGTGKTWQAIHNPIWKATLGDEFEFWASVPDCKYFQGYHG